MYRKKIIKIKNIIYVSFYHYFKRYILNYQKRNQRYRKTTNEQKIINERNSKKTLHFLILNNFKKNDLYITLTINSFNNTNDSEINTNIENFLRKLRYLYKKSSKNLKYIYTIEKKESRPHIHLLINFEKEIPTKKINEKWNLGYTHFTQYDGDTDSAERLCNYFLKENKYCDLLNEDICREYYQHRWKSSQNLIKPNVEVEDYVSIPPNLKTAPSGYQLITLFDTFDINGYRYINYKLVPIS